MKKPSVPHRRKPPRLRLNRPGYILGHLANGLGGTPDATRSRAFCAGSLSESCSWLSVPPAVIAHHSFAVFDHTQSVTVNGTVTKFQWTNPHGFSNRLQRADGSAEALHHRVDQHQHAVASRVDLAIDQSRRESEGDRGTASQRRARGPAAGSHFVGRHKLVSPVPAANTFNRTPEKELK